MGYTQVRVSIVGLTSSHNSEQDEIDEALWDEVLAQVQAIKDDPRFAPLMLS